MFSGQNQTIIGTGHRGMMNGGQTIVNNNPQKANTSSSDVTNGQGLMGVGKPEFGSQTPTAASGGPTLKRRNRSGESATPRKIITAAEVISGVGHARKAYIQNQLASQQWAMMSGSGTAGRDGFAPAAAAGAPLAAIPGPSQPVAATTASNYTAFRTNPFGPHQKTPDSMLLLIPVAQPSSAVEMNNAMRRGIPIASGSIVRKLAVESYVPPLEVDDVFGDDKRVAYQRYRKNQHLMKAVLSDTIVPNTMKVVQTKDLNHKRSQVAALENLLKKEEEETATILERHAAKLKAIQKSKEEHDAKFAVTPPPITAAQIQRLSDRMYENYKQEMRRKKEAHHRASVAARIAGLGSPKRGPAQPPKLQIETAALDHKLLLNNKKNESLVSNAATETNAIGSSSDAAAISSASDALNAATTINGATVLEPAVANAFDAVNHANGIAGGDDAAVAIDATAAQDTGTAVDAAQDAATATAAQDTGTAVDTAQDAAIAAAAQHTGTAVAAAQDPAIAAAAHAFGTAVSATLHAANDAAAKDTATAVAAAQDAAIAAAALATGTAVSATLHAANDAAAQDTANAVAAAQDAATAVGTSQNAAAAQNSASAQGAAVAQDAAKAAVKDSAAATNDAGSAAIDTSVAVAANDVAKMNSEGRPPVEAITPQ